MNITEILHSCSLGIPACVQSTPLSTAGHRLQAAAMERSATASLEFGSAHSYLLTRMPNEEAMAAAGAVFLPKRQGVGLLSQITAYSQEACLREGRSSSNTFDDSRRGPYTDDEKRLHSALCPA